MAIKKVIDVEVKDNFSEATEHAKQFNKETTNTKENLKGVTDVADKATGGMASKFSALTSVIGSVAKGFTTLKGAIIASGIGGLALIIGGVISAFKTSEEGQNKFAKIMGVIGAVVGNLIDILSDLGDKVISVFENPKKAIADFANLIKQNIVNRFNGLLELIPKLGKAIGQLFKGDFAGAAKTAADASAKVALGIENITDKINNATEATKRFIEEQKREMKLASDVADMRANADKIDRKLLVEKAKLEGDIAELKLKSRDIDNYTAQQRLKFLKDAQDLEDALLEKEQKALELRYESQKLENTFSRTDKENADKEAQAEAALLNIKTRRLDQQRATLREINRTNKEIRAEEKARLAEEKRINDEKTKAEKEAKDLAYKEAKDRLAKEIELQDKQYDLLQEATNSRYEQEIFQLTKQYDAKFELAMGNAELEKALEEKQKEEINAIKDKYRKEEEAKQKEADEKLAADNKKKLEDELKLQEQKIDSVRNSFTTIGNLAELFAGQSEKEQKKAFKVKKAADTANAVIDTYKAATGAYASLAAIPVVGPVLGAAAAGAAVTAGLLNVKKIQSQQFGGGATGGGSSAPSFSAGGGSESRAPQFNIVGQGGVGQAQFLEQKPVQAFVVSGEVTSQQALDRNRLRNATL